MTGDAKALWQACDNGLIEQVKKELKKDIDVNERWDLNDEKEVKTTFFIACKKGYTEIVKLILADKRVDVNIPTPEHKTPFEVACENGHTDVVKLLLADERVETEPQLSTNQSALDLALKNEHEKVITLLLAKELTKPEYSATVATQKEHLDLNVLIRYKTVLNQLFPALGVKLRKQLYDDAPLYYIGEDISGTNWVVSILKPQITVGNPQAVAFNSHSMLENALAQAKLACDEYQQCIALLAQAAKNCEREIMTPIFQGLRSFVPLSRETQTHAHGLARCRAIIENAEKLAELSSFSKKKTTVGLDVSGEAAQAAITQYQETLEKIITAVRESRVSGNFPGLFGKGNPASLNTHLIALYDKYPHLFGKEGVHGDAKPEAKVDAIIEKLESMKKVQEKFEYSSYSYASSYGNS